MAGVGHRDRLGALHAIGEEAHHRWRSIEIRAADASGTARWVELSRQSRLARPLPSPQTFKNRVTFARLETIRVPTLLISGGADLYAPPPVMRLFADRMKGAETIAVPDAGHSTFWEQAELFNRSLLTFLKRY